MKKGYRFIFALMTLCAIIFVLGCAKKNLEPAKVEVSPPIPPVSAEQPGMKMEAPKTDEAATTQVQKPTLEQARAAFTDSDIRFEFDKFDLTAEARKILADKARFMNAHPQIKIRIGGHCDERGTQEYNLALGERRAKTVLDYLVFLGIGPERITTVSYGEEKPLDPGHSEEAWAKNRRAHFEIL
jgi:peptidoglycan-associated lipoprotein